MRWLCMAALSLCLFDIWPEHRARMKRTGSQWRESERRDGCVFISCLAECSQKEVKDREGRGNGRQTALTSKQKYLNDLLGERESRI